METMDQVLKLKDITRLINRSPSAINRDRRAGNFPQPIRLGARSVGWRASEIQRWMDARVRVAATGRGN